MKLKFSDKPIVVYGPMTARDPYPKFEWFPQITEKKNGTYRVAWLETTYITPICAWLRVIAKPRHTTMNAAREQQANINAMASKLDSMLATQKRGKIV